MEHACKRDDLQCFGSDLSISCLSVKPGLHMTGALSDNTHHIVRAWGGIEEGSLGTGKV